MISFIGKPPDALRTWLCEHQAEAALEQVITRPLLPLPDNFTPPTRMPWGGTNIRQTYKRGLPIREAKQYPIVGESWEISADPAAPSEFVFDLDDETILVDFIQLLDMFPRQILGPGVAQKFDGQNPILAKIIDSADHLSVQVHPSDEYPGLSPHESGKPECWYILQAESGGGLYLGLKAGVSRKMLRKAIEQHEDVSQYLNFVEVQTGDFFVIDAGTIHAIGAGVTLIEPQKIAPRKSGKTYRLWDWNRKYDAQGRKDPHGQPRELHVDESFDVIQFDDPRGPNFVRQIQPQPSVVQQHGDCTETCCVETENFGVSQIVLEPNGVLHGDCRASFHGILPYAGRLEIVQQGCVLTEIICGQAAIVPAALGEYTLKGAGTQAVKVYYPDAYLD